MRPHLRLAPVAVLLVAAGASACGGGGRRGTSEPADAGTVAQAGDDAGVTPPPGSVGGESDGGPATSTDAGTVADAGPSDGGTQGAPGDAGPAPEPDAGATDAGVPDSGPADAGTADAGTPDAGTVSKDCEGLVPAPGTSGQLVQQVSMIPTCLPAVMEGGGSTVAIGIGLHFPAYQVYPADGGAAVGSFNADHQDTGPSSTALVATEIGYQALRGTGPESTVDRGTFAAYDAQGKLIASGTELDGQPRLIKPDPTGGSALHTIAGPLGGPYVNRLELVDAAGHRRAAAVLDRYPTDLAVGTGGHVLVTSGAAARWYDGEARPLTDWFLMPPFAPSRLGSRIVLEPLAGGAVGVRENDDWTYLVHPGEGRADRAPSWLAARPGTDGFAIRGGRATALVRNPVAVSTCGEPEVEVLTAAGESCGVFHLGSGPTCSVAFGRGGTATTLTIEQLTDPSSIGYQRCTWRWWYALAP